MSEERKTYSIALRVRRMTYEDAYVAVPVTDKILERKEDGKMGVNADAFFAEAIRISEEPGVEWMVEGSQREPHPEQRAAPEGRSVFDAFYSAEA